MSNKARRAFMRSLGPGPLLPAQIGVGVFSAVFLVAGLTVFAVAAPPLLPAENASNAASLTGEVWGAAAAHSASTTEGDAASSESSQGGDAAASLEGAGVPADVGSGTTGGSVSFPSVTAPVVEPSASDAVNSGGGGSPSQGSSNSSSGDSSSQPSQDDSQNPAPTGPSEAEEQATLAYLRSAYDGLAPHQQRIAQDYAEFSTLAVTPSQEVRLGYLNEAISSFNQVTVALIDVEENNPGESSRYYASWGNIRQLYSDLANAAGILRRAWLNNSQFADPTSNVDAWMSPIEENSVDGKLTFFIDYESRYPGARP